MQVSRIAAFGAAALAAGGLNAYATHRFWDRTQRTSFSNGWVLGGYVGIVGGATAIAASLLSRGSARTMLRLGGLGAITGAVAGWGAYVKATGRDAWALPFDPEMRAAKGLRTRHAEKDPGEGVRGEERQRSGDALTFSVVGDYGGGTNEQEQIAANIDASNPRFIVTVGDNVQTTGTDAEWRDKWDRWKLFGKLQSKYDVHPALGNHDIMGRHGPKAYFARFPELAGKHWYSFERDGITFFTLDSNQSIAPGSEQHRWLERELSQAGEGWKVLNLHHPLMSGEAGNDEHHRRDQLGPLLARYGVDLVLAGHQHAYERSRPLNEHGTLHVTVGSGGDTTRPLRGDPPAWSAYRRAAMGHLEVEVAGDELVGRYRLRDGSVDDTWAIRRAGPSA